ncbi:amino-acid N-acetyltransferase [Litorivivens sp.]|uniref:amino-acid N-acetyltransferase n=3 Tax=Litorivivens sp. TaxID=2020868 RepID=UPI0035692E1F
MADDTSYIKWFRNSAPYINAHRGKTFVLMISGEAIEHTNFDNIIHDIALLNSLGVNLVLVHGARPQIESRVQQQGIDSRFHQDLRITDAGTLACVCDAAGSVRAHIEALLSMGVANSPMHGAAIRVVSGNYVTAKPFGVIDGVDLEHTGQVRRVDADAIHRQLAQDNVVLISPLGYSPTGEIFNIALEDIVVETAAAIKADKLIVFDELPGVICEGDLIRECELSEARDLLPTAENDYALLTVIRAAERGIPRCHLIGFAEDGALLEELYTRDGAGTLVSNDHYEELATATIDDVGGILEIIAPLEHSGVLVKRSREVLETEIHCFRVIRRDGVVIACAALYPYPEQATGEVACVATHPDYRRSDRGERLLRSLEKYARQQRLQSVFVLTTQTAHWFQEQGFAPSSIEALPPGKQQLYNFQRNSKVFVKQL